MARSVAPTADLPCPACKKLHAGSAAAALKRLAETPAKVKALVRGLDARGFATRYGPGKWNVRQLVCHLRDCELMFGVRWRLILSEERPTLQSFDQDLWADSANYAKQDAKAALATLVALRAGNLEMLKLASGKALDRVGHHAQYGPITIAQMARHLSAHDENHLGHLKLARAAWSQRK